MLNKEQNDERSDATEDDSSNAAGQIKKIESSKEFLFSSFDLLA
jgi:hypothetical protein